MNFEYKRPVARAVIVLMSLILLAISPTLAQPDPLPLPPSPESRANVWAVTLTPGANPDEVAARMGLINGGEIPGTPNTYAFREPARVERADTETMQAMSTGLSVSPEVVSAVQQVLLERTTRVPTDPGYGSQWHLNNTGQFGGTPGADVNVEAAWALGYTGAGVVVASVDDGLWHTNPDLNDNYFSSASWDFGNNNPNPEGGWHGTSVGGVMAGVNNNDIGSPGPDIECGVGAAYNADLAGIRILNASTDASEAQALSNAFNTLYDPNPNVPGDEIAIDFAPIDIFNNSWGPFDDGRRLEGPGPLTEVAIANGVGSGRGGLGAIYVWAAGNGGNSDSVNADGYANSRYTIAVGASTNQGERSYYSEQGSPVLINAPSDGGTAGIRTTYGGPSGCTTSFGGTSSAAPLAAGVIALMLEANPSLTWRDVQHILVQSAEQNDPTDTGWMINGAGRPFNHYYGFGRIDAGAAVTLADTWVSVEPEISVDSGTLTVNTAISDGLSESQAGPWVTSTFNVTQNIEIESVDVVFDADHGWRGDLQVELISPMGMKSVLMHGRSADNQNDYSMWRFGSVAHWGEMSVGTWTIRVRDLRQHLPASPGGPEIPNTGTFKSWRLTLYGTMSGNTLITRQPAAATEVLFDEAVSLSVQAIGGEPITYQWYLGASGDTSSPISGATGSTYTTPALQSDMQVWVRATGSLTSTDSATSVLSVVNEVALLADEHFNDSGFNDWITSNNEARIICGKNFFSASCALKLKNTKTAMTRVTQRVLVGEYPWTLRAGDTLKVTGMFKASAGVNARLRLMIDYTSPDELEVFSRKIIVKVGWHPLEITHVLDRTDIQRIRVRLKDKSKVIGAKMFADDVQLVHQRGGSTRAGTANQQLLPPPDAPAEFRGGN